jgi:magnesium transporter
MYNPLLLPDLKQMIEEEDAQGLEEFCEALHPAVAAEVLEGLEPHDIWTVVSTCSIERQVELFDFLSLPLQVELVDGVDRERLSKLIEEMAPDDRADLLARLDPERVKSLLPLIAQAERSDIRKLLSFPDESAGAIMTTEYASLPEGITAGEAIDRLRLQAPDRETIYYVYVLDEGRRLDGFISLRQLILARPDTMVEDIMRKKVISVRVDDDQETVAHELARYDFLAIPVVDNQNQLVGIITHDDVLDILQEEATEDAHRQGAVEPLEDSYLETPLITIVWKRGIWLLFLAIVALFTAQVLRSYEQASEAYVWIIWFLPLVLASGGNAGSQSATLIIRTIALGELEDRENLRMAQRELILGLGLGLALASLGFAAAVLSFGRTPLEATVVGLTVLLVVVMGTVSGALLPIGFKRLGMDPALMSNPLIAALVDVLGVIIYYSVAAALLSSIT